LVYQQKKELESAVIEFQKCIATDPEFEEAQLRLGFSLAQLGRYVDAIPHLKSAVALNGDRAEAHYALAAAYAGSGDTEAARPEFKAACRIKASLCQPPQQ
jgi:tetratricopeptide (TPR) repeat protein